MKHTFAHPLILGIAFILLITCIFYWFEYRPTKIRQDCSWVSRHENAVPERPAKTEQQLRQEGLLTERNGLLNAVREARDEKNNVFLDAIDKARIEEYKQPVPAKPAMDWFEKASDREYQFCIRSKGITK